MDDVVWRRVEHRSVWPTLLWSVAMIAFAGIGNGLCDPHLTFLPFYVVPVAFAGWRGGLGVGLIIAVLGMIAFVLGAGLNPHRQAEMTARVLAWNTLGRGVTFLPIAFLASKLHQSLAMSSTARSLDPLTGVMNRGAFFRRAASALLAAHNRGQPSALAIFDIQELQQINAHYGTQRGDVIISMLARALWESSRKRDVVARTDGSTLAIFMPATASEEAAGVVRQSQQRFADLSRGTGVPVSLIAALCTTAAQTTSLEEMMVVVERAADAAESPEVTDTNAVRTAVILGEGVSNAAS